VETGADAVPRQLELLTAQIERLRANMASMSSGTSTGPSMT